LNLQKSKGGAYRVKSSAAKGGKEGGMKKENP